MAETTTNYDLIKPAKEDFINIDELNSNFDKIDDELKKRVLLNDAGKISTDQLPSMDYIPTGEKGAAKGVATLGADGKVPASQLPDMNYIPTSQKGAAGGVASLGADGKVPANQLPVSAVDTALSATSENPVQNKVITQAIGDIGTILDEINGEVI